MKTLIIFLSFALGGCASIPLLRTPQQEAALVRNRVSHGGNLTVLVGHSNEPLIHDGQRCFIKLVAYENLRKGDIADRTSLEHPGNFAHPIISGDPSHGFITQGFANKIPDKYPMTKDCYIGVLVGL